MLTADRAEAHWDGLMSAMAEWMHVQGVSPARTVVLVPYAQLMTPARQAWARFQPSGFAPRFESSRNWAAGLLPFAPGPMDWSGDTARDALVAAALVDRVARSRSNVAMRSALAARLLEATRSLAPRAASVAPDERVAWGQAQLEAMGAGLQSPVWEGLIVTLAVTWASSSAYATDVLWGPLAAPGVCCEALVVLQGFQADPLAEALLKRWVPQGTRSWPLHEPGQPGQPAMALHACESAEDEAQRSAACVIRHVNAGRVPVALLAHDRLLTRRIRALLDSAGVAVRDETGWKLSTTHAAAQLMALLRAAGPRASVDEVLNAMKLSPLWGPAHAQVLETLARRHGVSRWSSALGHPALSPEVPEPWQRLLLSLQKPRTLPDWLLCLAQALRDGGWWDAWAEDAAGTQLVSSLHLRPGAAARLSGSGTWDASAAESGGAQPSRSWTLGAFSAWVSDVLEGGSFMPASLGDEPVVILPMAHQLGRTFAATVSPGCDERSLSTHPDPPGPWTETQRKQLGLPSRGALALATAQAWQAASLQPHLDVLWRVADRGESVQPNAWVLAARQAGAPEGLDPRVPLEVCAAPYERPAPQAPGLLPDRLSASAYQDLRDCPYRFFALRQLRLSDAEELEGEPDQRDMGNWLHAVLRSFHEARRDQRPGRQVDRQALDQSAQATSEAQGLQSVSGDAGFLPFEAVWPSLREGYLDWLEAYEAIPGRAGPSFEAAEVERTASVGRWRLLGNLDRIDHQPSPEGRLSLVIDYKTESRERTLDRVKDPLEDTQLAFYAALLPEDNLRAAYLSITDKRGGTARNAATLLIEQPDILLAREALMSGLEADLERMAEGHAMPALGEGRVCEYCAARGLCRRDDWSAS
ncbi:PD-(D/E)XK nuclease family protein [Hydrogenophaga sp. PAMC20947]|uniref:PD-(D/E)XK nuclease family protein n=1 Tax=Hydrogenophaga sp. PAMC20947 TaxID=2565558 RepID=UPI0014468365|nr:PD-(D/E)XK nuclease family protein [Hydrogenophaga sp. PAMC20947]